MAFDLQDAAELNFPQDNHASQRVDRMLIGIDVERKAFPG